MDRKTKNTRKFFALLAYALAFGVALTGCINITWSNGSLGGRRNVAGNGRMQEKQWELEGGVYSFSIEGIYFVSITTGQAGGAKIEIDEALGDTLSIYSDENILQDVEVSIDEGAKTIKITGNESYAYTQTGFALTLGVAVEECIINGGYTLNVNAPSAQAFRGEINGACDASLTFDELDTFHLEVNGATSLQITGRCGLSVADIQGAAEISAFEFITERAEITLSGAANYAVYATEYLKATVRGVGAITYDGRPQRVEKDIAGLGIIEMR